MPLGAIKGSPWRDLYVHMLHKSTMKMSRKILLGGLAALILTAPLMADVTYTYTGNDFEVASGFPYSTSDFVSGFFTVSSALGDSRPDSAVTTTSYSFTDGVQTFYSSSPPAEVTIEVGTGLTGSINVWDINLSTGPPDDNYVSTDSVSTDGGSNGGAYAYNLGDPGGWKQSGGGGSTVPEPGYVGLLGIGLAAIVFVQRKLQRGRA